MSNKTITLSDDLYDYLIAVSLRESLLLQRLREETAHDEMARMQISPELWGGDLINPQDKSEDTEALRAFNQKLHGDARVTLSLVPIGDGLTLARKR